MYCGVVRCVIQCTIGLGKHETSELGCYAMTGHNSIKISESVCKYTSIRCFVVTCMSYIIIKVGNIGISMCRYSSTVCVSTVGLYSIFHLDVNVCEVLLNCLST